MNEWTVVVVFWWLARRARTSSLVYQLLYARHAAPSGCAVPLRCVASGEAAPEAALF